MSSKSRPLEGVVACLTGMSPSMKDQYHEWIEALGGSFTRDFHTARNTHLIANSPTGAKYETAMAVSTIQVVKPLWLEECHEQQCRLDEEDYSYQHDNDDDDDDDNATTGTNSTNDTAAKRQQRQSKRKKERSSSSHKKTKHSSDNDIIDADNNRKQALASALEKALAVTTTNSPTSVSSTVPNPLFSCCQVYMIGFDCDDSADKERKQLCRLIRRGMGTVFWEFHSDITHVIVYDHCEDAVRESISKAKAEIFETHVTVVSPWWIVESWQQNTLLSPFNYPPQLEKTRKRQSKQQNHKKEKSLMPTSKLLRGSFFVVLRVSTPAPWMVDYDAKELEKLIRCNGGQILSSKLVETLKADQAQQQEQARRRNVTSVEKRTCLVLCWGANATLQKQQVALHPLLTQIQRKELCKTVMVTPNWLETCIAEQKLVNPEDIPTLFQPQAWPWRKFQTTINGTAQSKQVASKNNSQSTTRDKENASIPTDNDSIGSLSTTKEDKSKQESTAIRISVTGFKGFQRTAIVNAIRAMGVTYDDSMHQHQTTHLICAKRSSNQQNPKFQKAHEWGIHVVSLDWLYHVLQHGREGDTRKQEENIGGTEETNESRFAVSGN